MSAEAVDIEIRARALLGEAQAQISSFLKEVEGKSVAATKATAAPAAGFESWTTKFGSARDAILGGFSSITEALGPMGTALAGAFTVGAITNAVSKVMSFASELSDMSAQTGIGTDALQQLRYAIAGTDVPLSTLTMGVSQLQKRLASGDDGAIKAITSLHLNLGQLLSESPDQMFLDIADAVREIPDPAQQAATMMELFGRMGIQLLPAVKDNLRELTEAAKDNGAVVDKELIEKADALGDAWNRTKIQGEALLSKVLLPMFTAAKTSGTDVLKAGVSGGEIPVALAGQFAQTLEAQIKAVAAAAPKLSEMLVGPKGLVDKSATAADIAAIEKVSERASKAAKQQIEDQKEAEKERARLLDERLDALLHAGDREVAITSAALGKQLAQLKLEYTPALIPIIDNGMSEALAKATPGVQGKTTTIGSLMGLHMAGGLASGFKDGLASIGSTLVASLEGGGNPLKAIAGTMGQSISQSMFGSGNFQKMITSHFGDALGGMFNALLPGIGALAGPLLGKLAGLFKGLFGGPDSAELAGREAFTQFSQAMNGLATAADRAEIKANVAKGATLEWATAAVVVKNAYIAAGRTGEEALDAIARAQAAEKQGGDAVKRVVDEINSVVGKQPELFKALGETGTAAFDSVATAAAGVTDSVNGISEAAASAYQQMLLLRGFNGGSGGEGTSDDRNVSHILDGLSESDARDAYLSGIANKGSTEKDWERVKDQYGFPGSAGGGVYTRPSFRVIAENKPEIVGEPSLIVDSLVSALRQVRGSSDDAMAPGGNTGPTAVHVYIGGEELDSRTIKVVQEGLANGRVRVGRRNLVERIS